ncbi:ABC transporter permease [Gammaproteobacteria bacterium]|nr:ABC transporter permease [Gammaproteobacteria bacterium]
MSSFYARMSYVGNAVFFLLRVLWGFPRRKEHVRELIKHLYLYGNRTVPIIVVAGAFIGMVITLQGYNSLVRFGAESEIGGLSAYSMYREMGPVVTALLFIGRVGSLLASEMSIMTINQQFVCMKMLAINANRMVVFPRFLAVVISVPLLSIIFCMSGVMSSYIVCDFALGVMPGMFWNSLEYHSLFINDVMHGVIKSFSFSVLIAWVALYQGLHSEATREGMASATTSTVVVSSLLILGLDYLITALLGG